MLFAYELYFTLYKVLHLTSQLNIIILHAKIGPKFISHVNMALGVL
uniref:Uncharacterized protein n=1 Tax=Anguilla anguilla TaxID=7936 RepID=A0A0E9RS89_ANGAN